MNLSPTETAARFGVSIKALKLYEQRGLLTPLRSEAGWRTYGPDQIARLHQILALKRLGLPLAKIGELLAGPDALEPVLALQEQVLARDSEQLSRALVLVRAARAKLAAGQALSIDDLATLTKETVMTARMNMEEVKALFAPLTAKHFTPEEASIIQHRKTDVAAEWESLKKKIRAMITDGIDPASAAAHDVAARARQLGRKMAGDDDALLAKIHAFRDEALADPRLSNLMDADVYGFLKKAFVPA
jgi:DNA-binding transcriptional MerR regulator